MKAQASLTESEILDGDSGPSLPSLPSVKNSPVRPSPFYFQKRALTNERSEARKDKIARAIVILFVIGLLVTGILLAAWSGRFVKTKSPPTPQPSTLNPQPSSKP